MTLNHTYSIANSCNYDITWMRCARAAMLTRRALHAGSWYVGSGEHRALKATRTYVRAFEIYSCPGDELTSQLDGWLSAVDVSHSPARAIIAPYPPLSHTRDCCAVKMKGVRRKHASSLVFCWRGEWIPWLFWDTLAIPTVAPAGRSPTSKWTRPKCKSVW